MKKAIITGLVAGVLSLSSVNALAAEKGTDENHIMLLIYQILH